MHLDLTDLRLLVNIDEGGSITAGAAATHMTLASASQRVRGLEDAVGLPLLLRDRRGVRPTPAGITVLRHARLVLQQIERMGSELRDERSGGKGHVRLMCNTSALSEHLPERLRRFLARHRGWSVDLDERLSHEIVDAVRNERCDVGVVADSVDMLELQTRPFCADPLVLIAPPSHSLATTGAIHLVDAIACDFVGLSEDSALQRNLALQARRLGKRLDYRIRLRSLDAVCRMVASGIGVAIVPRATARRCARSMAISQVPLKDPWARRSLVLCARDFDALPDAAATLVRHLLAK